jgi:putative MATE family efflux protein
MAGISIPFTFLNLFYTNVLIGYGDSRSPFRINTISFLVNIILDFLLIFIAGFGINGAAAGTVISQALATLLFYKKLNGLNELRPTGVTFRKILLRKIVTLSISPTLQRVSFTLISIGMARIITNWGATAIAVQKVGIQIEAISYLTAGGFMSALSSLSGKAFGAKDYTKQWNIFVSGMTLAIIIGVVTSLILIVFPEPLFSIFLRDKESLAMGSNYLVILGYSQLFMCLELMATGAFFGWGRTNIPAITGISLKPCAEHRVFDRIG